MVSIVKLIGGDFWEVMKSKNALHYEDTHFPNIGAHTHTFTLTDTQNMVYKLTA